MVNKIKKEFRNYYLFLSGRSPALKAGLRLNYQWYGNQYGGFFVYPDRLNENSIVYSFGIGEDISFDLQLISKFKCQVFGFDPTPKSVKWINSQELSSRFVFNPFGIGKETGLTTFFLPKNNEHVSGSVCNLDSVNLLEPVEVPMKTFADITGDQQVIDILKMDIEGSEYQVLPDILESGVIIKQILIEFHHRMFHNGAELTKHAITILKENGFELFAFSDTNEELSFININYL